SGTAEAGTPSCNSGPVGGIGSLMRVLLRRSGYARPREGACSPVTPFPVGLLAASCPSQDSAQARTRAWTYSAYGVGGRPSSAVVRARAFGEVGSSSRLMAA